MERGDGQHDNLLAFQAFLDSSPEAREPVVEITAFRRLCAKGIPDHPKHLRPLAYSLLLEILPANKREWRSQLRRRRREYHELVQRYMTELEAMDLVTIITLGSEGQTATLDCCRSRTAHTEVHVSQGSYNRFECITTQTIFIRRVRNG
ncbi:hypothetical protein BD324DRAFT_649534 [Kockovaella imperatae]|uniref:Uncharacterized protein n=1 Tax=Kockovaella imperatae TaxID=4999 RepID=A0A1Y1UJB3_9TREE|nr:hypothetical protein BD324DRAFT_649534 [Kockovaella imperatae]ORX38151.1 hypothetical protein BD324DRAFT_649534 [Kockovaella imperatae]